MKIKPSVFYCIAYLVMSFANAGGLESPQQQSSKKLAEQRQNNLLALDKALANMKPCGTVSGLGNPNYFAFPKNQASPVYFERYDLIGIFEASKNKGKIVWIAGLGNRFSIIPKNTFTKYFSKVNGLSLDFECGKQSIYQKDLTMFQITVPPGRTVVGNLNRQGEFMPDKAIDFTNRDTASQYENWIIDYKY